MWAASSSGMVTDDGMMLPDDDNDTLPDVPSDMSSNEFVLVQDSYILVVSLLY